MIMNSPSDTAPSVHHLRRSPPNSPPSSAVVSTPLPPSSRFSVEGCCSPKGFTGWRADLLGYGQPYSGSPGVASASPVLRVLGRGFGPSWCALHEPMLRRPPRELVPRRQLELAQDVRHVALHRLHREVQARGDLLVHVAARDQL